MDRHRVLSLTVSDVFGLESGTFSLSRVRLEVEVAAGNSAAIRVLAIRQDPNIDLTTVLPGKVAINVCLDLLYSLAGPVEALLDRRLGPRGFVYFRERQWGRFDQRPQNRPGSRTQ
jgi:hypothetical protein